MRFAFALLLMLAQSAWAAPSLRLTTPWRGDAYANVEVVGAGQGEHVLNGRGVAMPTRWPGGRTVVLPLLVGPGAAEPPLTLELDGAAVRLDVGDLPDVSAEQRPIVGVIDERTYAATAGWRPGRPWAERVAVAVLAGAFVVIAATLAWLVRRPGLRVSALAGLSLVACVAVIVHNRTRPPLAVREATIHAGDVADRWLFLSAPASLPEPATPRVAIVGETRPVAFSRSHLEMLSPTLACDADGTPLFVTLTLAAGTQAAVLQRTPAAVPVGLPPPWAGPLVRRLYPAESQRR